MIKWSLSPRAETDIKDIWRYIAEYDVRAADRLVENITQRLEQLSMFPDAAEVVRHSLSNLRRTTVENYVIYYRRLSDHLDIVRVIHGARDIDLLL